MARGTLVRPSKVKPLVCSPKYISRMLLDHTNSESKKIQVNHGIIAPGAALLPPKAHGTLDDPYDETYVILKGKCKIFLDGEVQDLEPGDVVFIPGGVYHGLDNSLGTEEVGILTIWAGAPPKGINEVYDLRIEKWGKSYKTIDEE